MVTMKHYENIYALTLIRLFGLLSMIGSGLIIRDIARKLYKRPGPFLQKVSLTQSILIVLSIGDFFGWVENQVGIFSTTYHANNNHFFWSQRAFFVQFISSWMVPHRSDLLGSVGSQRSCVAQGILSNFFYSLSATSNASLAVAYCLIVRYKWKDREKNKTRLPFVLIPIFISTVLAVVPLFGKNYNYNGGYSCYIR